MKSLGRLCVFALLVHGPPSVRAGGNPADYIQSYTTDLAYQGGNPAHVQIAPIPNVIPERTIYRNYGAGMGGLIYQGGGYPTTGIQDPRAVQVYDMYDATYQQFQAQRYRPNHTRFRDFRHNDCSPGPHQDRWNQGGGAGFSGGGSNGYGSYGNNTGFNRGQGHHHGQGEGLGRRYQGRGFRNLGGGPLAGGNGSYYVGY